MKKEFIIPKIEISSFAMENILLASGVTPTNSGSAQQLLTEGHKVDEERIVVITF